MKKLIVIFSGIFLLIVSLTVREKVNNSRPVYCKYVDDISNSFLAASRDKYGLTCSGRGGALMDKVNVVFLGLDSKENDYDVEKARRLIVNCSEDYLERINSNKKVREYLSHYPFTHTGINFRISFRNPNERAIRLIILTKGKISYSAYNEDRSDLIDQHVETYEEAREIVMAGQGPAIDR
jgi:hypothetical protein